MKYDVDLPTNYKGIRTSLDPLTVPPGYLSRGENIRNDDGVASQRGGQALIDASGLTGTYKGGGLFEYDGNVYYFFAIDEGNSAPDTQIYWSIYSSSSWSGPQKLTAASGQWGATEMNNPETGFVTFTPVPGLYGTKYVVVQNGVDSPRLITIAITPIITVIESIPAPNQAQAFSPKFTFPDFLDITQGSPTISNSNGTDFGAATNLSGAWDFYFANTSQDGDTALIYNTNTVDLRESEQIGFICETTYINTLLDYLKLEIRDSSGNFYTIHDPENGKYNVLTQQTNKSNFQVLWFPVSDHNQVASLENIVGIRGTLIKDYTATGTERAYIYGIVASGRVPGGAQYAVSWTNEGTQAESPSVVLRNSTQAITVADIYGATGTTVEFDTEIPVEDGVYYAVNVPTFAPSTTQRDKGVDYMNVYRKDPGDADFYYTFNDELVEYSASTWSYVSPFSTSVNQTTVKDIIYTWAKDVTRNAPGAYVESVPTAGSGAFSGDRMYFGVRGSGADKASVKVSDQGFPFRFRSLPISGFSEQAGYRAVLDGERNINAVVAGSSSVVGGGFVYVFTAKSCYTVSDYLITKISNTGCAGNSAWAIEDNRIWFLDQDLQVRVMDGSIGNISRYTVHNIFSAITSPDLVSFARWQGRLYCKTGVNEVMVFSDRTNDWESRDTPGEDVYQFLRWDFLGQSKLYYGGENCDLGQYETGNLDIAAQIPIGITWPEMRSPDWGQFKQGDAYIVCTDKDSETATFVFTSRNPAQTATGTASLDAGAGETTNWRKFSDSGKDIAVRGCSITPKLDMTVEGPMKIYGVKIKSSVAGRGAQS